MSPFYTTGEYLFLAVFFPVVVYLGLTFVRWIGTRAARAAAVAEAKRQWGMEARERRTARGLQAMMKYGLAEEPIIFLAEDNRADRIVINAMTSLETATEDCADADGPRQ